MKCFWCCYHSGVIARVHPVYLMNREQFQATTDHQTQLTDLDCESCWLVEAHEL